MGVEKGEMGQGWNVLGTGRAAAAEVVCPMCQSRREAAQAPPTGHMSTLSSSGNLPCGRAVAQGRG